MLPHLHPLLAVSTWQRLRRLGGPGLVSVGRRRQFRHSAHRQHGRADHLAGGPPSRAVAVLRLDGNAGRGDRRLHHLQPGPQGRQSKPWSAGSRKGRAAKVYKAFERWGFSAVAIPALLPPPFPFVPFLLAAGAMQYSRQKFLARSYPRPRDPLFHRRLPGIRLWKPHPAILLAILQTGHWPS